MKNHAYIYIVHIPGDCLDSLEWFRILPTRTEANEYGRQKAKDLGDDWKFVYLSNKSHKNYIDYEGKRTVVCEQATEYFFGA